MKLKIFLLICGVITITACKSSVDVYEGFEKPGLSRIWSSDRMVKGAFKIQSDIVRQGQSAAMITLKPGDVFEAGTNGWISGLKYVFQGWKMVLSRHG
jgi:hypothetical protein